MRKIYSLLILLMLSITAKSQTDFTIGSATGSNTGSTYPCPIQDFFEGSRAQYLYLASELQAAGVTTGFIHSIKFNVTALTAPTTANPFTDIEQYQISIGTTTTGSLTATSWESGTTPVYGPVDYTPVLGDNEFVFTTPFFWDGVDNIVLDICNGASVTTPATFWTNNIISPFTSGLSFNGSHTFRADNINNLCGTATTTNTGSQTTRPDVILSWVSATACTGTPAGGLAVSSRPRVCANQPFSVSTTGAALGSGLTYEWESSTDNINFSLNGGTGFSFQVPAGITVNTWYRRRINCTFSSLSDTSKRVLVEVRPFYECYCSPNTSNALHSSSTAPTIESVAISGNAVNYSNSHTGSSVAPTLGYAAFTDTTGVNNPPIPVLKQATTYTLTLGTSATPISNAAGYWIDWNHDGTFAADEFVRIPFVSATTSADIEIDVPANATLGLTLLRIRTSGAAFTSANSCTAFGNGETEEYIFRVIAASPCTGTPVGGTTVCSVSAICPTKPFSLSVSGATEGVLNLNYRWEYSTNNGTTWDTVANATSKSLSVTAGITVGTCYRRKITCGANSSFSAMVCVAMNAVFECYCSPLNGQQLHASAGSPSIELVTVGGGALSYFNNHPGVNPNPSFGYAIFYDTASFQVEQAKNYTLTVTTSLTPTKSAVWIDWDRNGVFDTYEFQNLTISTTSSTIDFSVPNNAPLGVYAMRIRTRGATFTTNACQSDYGSGETEDYVFKVIPGTACSGTPLGGDAETIGAITAICPNTQFIITVANSTDGVTGLKYSWEYSTNNGVNWSHNTADTNRNLTINSIIVNTCYRRKVTCGVATATSTQVCITVNAIIDCYCSPKNGQQLHASAGSPSIEQIDVNGGTVSYTNAHPGFNPAPSFGYNIVDDTLSTFSLIQGTTYDLTVTASVKPTQAAVWIDWDRSGSFEVSEFTPIVFNSATETVSLTVPLTATPGATNMRFRIRGATFTTDACQSDYGSGETEDYIFRVIATTPCNGSPVGGTTITPITPVCLGTKVFLNVTGATDGVLGLSYQWQDSTASGSWQNIVGHTNSRDTAIQSIPKYYRRKITCANGGLSTYSTPVFVGTLSSTYATIPFTEDFENTWEDGCGAVGSRSIPTNNWRNTPVMTDSSWRRNDDGVAANWNFPALGVYSPTASSGSFSARFHSERAPNGTSGNFDLYVNCATTSPFKRLTYDFINTSGTDGVQVLLSTDGGNTFTKIDTFTLAGAWTSRILNFTSASATTVIRFRATADFGATDIGLDNIAIIELTALDLTATAIVAPTGTFAFTPAGTITVTIKNLAGGPINFATNNATVGARVVNPLGVTNFYSIPVTTGTLAIGASQDVIVTTAANFSTVGCYTIKAGVGVTGDAIPANDSTAVGGFCTSSAVVTAIANGNWGDGSTWNTGSVPTALDTVNITGFTVALTGASPSPYFCSSLGIGAGGTLNAATNILNLGPNGGGSKAFTLATGASLNITGGTLNTNGFLLINDGANFAMTSGNLNIDGNSGADVGSVPNGLELLAFGTATNLYTTGTLNITGGTITIVDPHRFGSNVLAYRANVSTNITAGNTLILGDGTSTHTTSTGAGGFAMNVFLGSARMSLGNLVVNGGNTVGNRYASSTVTLGINGNLTINPNSEARYTFLQHIAGNFTNNGVYASSSTVNLQSYLSGTAAASTNAQIISGAGVYRNTVPTAVISAAGSGYAVGNVLTVVGGTSSTPATIYVLRVNGAGGILAAVILNTGSYTVAPTGVVTVTGGAGTGATFTTTNLVSTAKFNNLVINNNNATGITISSLGTTLASQTGTVSGTLTMTAGIINNGTNTITLGTGIAALGTLTYTNGVITGTFKRWFAAATNATSTGDFPVGKGSFARKARVEFTIAPTTGGALTAEYVATAPGLGGFPITDGITLANIDNNGFWRIDAENITGGNYTLSLIDTGITNVQTVSTLRTVKRATGATNWAVNGAAGVNSGSVGKPTVVRTGMSGFSEFAIAGANDNTLPYASIKFTGEKVGNTNQLKWTVTNEVDIRSYDLQRSNDGVNYTAITNVFSKSMGSLVAKLDYAFADNNSIANDGYYRLKQIAKDGSVSYSNIVLIKGLRVTGVVVGNVYPNPVKDILSVMVASSISKSVTAIVTSINGKQVVRTNHSLTNGDNLLKVNLSRIAAGTYTIVMLDASGSKSNVVTFVKE